MPGLLPNTIHQFPSAPSAMAWGPELDVSENSVTVPLAAMRAAWEALRSRTHMVLPGPGPIQVGVLSGVGSGNDVNVPSEFLRTALLVSYPVYQMLPAASAPSPKDSSATIIGTCEMTPSVVIVPSCPLLLS